jgi:predicted metal-dependent hydrolase
MNRSHGRHEFSKHTVVFGSETIEFTLSFSQRKQLSIEVQTDGMVIVKAPDGTALNIVMESVRKRAGWIIRQRDRFESFSPCITPKRYISGETHRYLGRQYRLRIAEGEVSSVKLIGRFFLIVTADKSNTKDIRKQLEQWYRGHAEQVFNDRVNKCLHSSYFRDLERPHILIRQMKRRWGSCAKGGSILLNPELIKTPVDSIDYVVTHELCHLIEHNHGPAYYRLLTRCMPDWQKRWKKLNSCEL